MKRLKFAVTGIAVLVAMAAGNALELSRDSFGLLRDTKVYIQEWHIWWGFPYPDTRQPLAHMGTTLTAAGEPWRLNWNRNGYPLIGLYDSINPEVIRWQIRCMKATGLESAAVMIHPEWNTGIGFIQEEKGNIVKTILDIAAEEQFPVFFMDEVAFRHGSVAQKIDVCVERIAGFLGKYANHPGFYRVDGKPVYYFQTYGWKVSAAEIEQMFRRVEASTGEVHWMMFGPVSTFSKVPQLKQIVDGANIHRRDRATRNWKLEEQAPAGIFDAAHRNGKLVADMQYPKFDGTGQPWRQHGVAVYGQGGRMLEKTVIASFSAKPDFMMLSSWNDWEEGANFEPGWDFDGVSDDPYLYCKVIAHLKGIEFVPPPFPAKEYVHPTIWEKLGYGDGAGPLVEKITRSHARGGSLTVTVRDSMSEVTGLEVVWDGDLFWKAAQENSAKHTGRLSSAGGVGASVQQQDIFGFTPGYAAELQTAETAFSIPAGGMAEQEFAVGAAWAFAPESPLDGLKVRLANRDEIRLYEPKGGVEKDMVLNLTPYPRANQFPEELWNGWRTNVAVTLRPADTSRGLRVQGGGRKLGLLSLLGKPRSERVLETGRSVTPDGLTKQFHIRLPDSVLETPGAHFVWFRARDAAGNWGSPVLYAVPNYEFFHPVVTAAGAAPESPLQIPGALIADNCATADGWKSVGNLELKVEAAERAVTESSFLLGNTLVYRELVPAIANGGFQLSFLANHVNYERKMIALLTDSEGKRGYGVAWDSRGAGQNAGNGVVQIVKYESDKPFSWNASCTVLGSANPGVPAVGGPLTGFEFSRNAGSDELVLKVNGKTLLSRTDAAFREFGRLYLRGNQSQRIDRIILTPLP